VSKSFDSFYPHVTHASDDSVIIVAHNLSIAAVRYERQSTKWCWRPRRHHGHRAQYLMPQCQLHNCLAPAATLLLCVHDGRRGQIHSLTLLLHRRNLTTASSLIVLVDVEETCASLTWRNGYGTMMLLFEIPPFTFISVPF
jgi:hypothetical protein